MNEMKKIALLVFFVVAGLACVKAQDGNTDYLLSAVQFSDKLKENPQVTLLDVRTPEEFSQSHLKDAINIDWNGKGFMKEASALLKNQPIYMYCLSGGRSHTAAEKLRSKGFTVYEMEGGIMQWKEAGLPEVKGEVKKNNDGMSLDEFDKLVSSHPYVMIDFSAPWCGPCKKMKPYIDAIEKEMNGDLKVIVVNTDENMTLVKKMKIYSIPYVQLYRDGKLKWENMGFTDEKYLRQVVNDFK